MKGDLSSFAAVIEQWPSAAELSRDLNDVTDISVRAWKVRGIPEQYWLEVIESAKKRDIKGVSLELLARLAALRAGRTVPKKVAA